MIGILEVSYFQTNPFDRTKMGPKMGTNVQEPTQVGIKGVRPLAKLQARSKGKHQPGPTTNNTGQSNPPVFCC